MRYWHRIKPVHVPGPTCCRSARLQQLLHRCGEAPQVGCVRHRRHLHAHQGGRRLLSNLRISAEVSIDFVLSQPFDHDAYPSRTGAVCTSTMVVVCCCCACTHLQDGRLPGFLSLLLQPFHLVIRISQIFDSL